MLKVFPAPARKVAAAIVWLKIAAAEVAAVVYLVKS